MNPACATVAPVSEIPLRNRNEPGCSLRGLHITSCAWDDDGTDWFVKSPSLSCFDIPEEFAYPHLSSLDLVVNEEAVVLIEFPKFFADIRMFAKVR